MSKKVRILSIDGGGIKGLVSGVLLAAIEKELRAKEGDHARISDYFDLVAGTSTGGILACLYLTPNGDARPKFTADEAVDIYLNRGGKIFHRSAWQYVKSFGGLLNEKYHQREIETTLKDYFGDTKLSDLLKPCLVTSYDVTERRATFFNQLDACKDSAYNFFIKDITRATSAAPTYFEMTKIKSDVSEDFPLVDGGVFANNPALCAYSEARNTDFGKINNPSAKDMMIVSFGTKDNLKSYQYRKMKRWGKVQWVVPVIDILMSSNSETVDYHLKQIFKATDNEDNYIRIETPLKNAAPEMDDASPENISALHEAASSYVASNKSLIENIADKLIMNK